MTTKYLTVTKSNAIQNELKKLHDTDGNSWRKISQMTKFRGIPERTLNAIATGKRDIPDKYCDQLGVQKKVKVSACSSCGKVHAIDRACEMEVIIKKKTKPKEGKQKEKHPRYYAWIFEQMTKEKDWR